MGVMGLFCPSRTRPELDPHLPRALAAFGRYAPSDDPRKDR